MCELPVIAWKRVAELPVIARKRVAELPVIARKRVAELPVSAWKRVAELPVLARKRVASLLTHVCVARDNAERGGGRPLGHGQKILNRVHALKDTIGRDLCTGMGE